MNWAPGSLGVDVSNERSAEETGKESYQGSYDEGSSESVALGSYDQSVGVGGGGNEASNDDVSYQGSDEEANEGGGGDTGVGVTTQFPVSTPQFSPTEFTKSPMWPQGTLNPGMGRRGRVGWMGQLGRRGWFGRMGR